MIVARRETPTKCTKCGSSIEQVPDVQYLVFVGAAPLDPWLTREKTRIRRIFYPTTLLITAYEILFFSVARMIMFGCHFSGREQDPAIKKASE